MDYSTFASNISILYSRIDEDDGYSLILLAKLIYMRYLMECLGII